MALFGRKKPDSTEPEPEVNGLAADDVEVNSADNTAVSFTPEPDKARKWFEHGRVAADRGQHDYAIHCYASGIKFDPEDMEAHKGMYEAAVRLHSKGARPAAGKDIKKIDGPHPVDRFAAAEFAWMRNLTSSSTAVRLIQACVKAEQNEFGRWFGPKLINVLASQKKPSKGDFVTAMKSLTEVGAWNDALNAGANALSLDPMDANLDTELKNISAQRAMDQGGYEEAGGEEGGFRKFVRDSDKQQELEETESLSGAGSATERNLMRAQAEYEENPLSPEAIQKYAQLIARSGEVVDEDKAKQVYLKGFADTKEYRFKMAASDLTMRQAERRLAEMQRSVQLAPDDDELQQKLEEMSRELMMYKSSEFQERVDRYPSDRNLKYRLGMVQFDLGRFEDAMGAFQQSKDEPKLRVPSGHRLGLCFAKEGWHQEAVGEFKEALDAIDATNRDRELDIRYDLMSSLMEHARDEKSIDLAKEALEICSGIARRDITYRDIRAKRKEVDALVKELGD